MMKGISSIYWALVTLTLSTWQSSLLLASPPMRLENLPPVAPKEAAEKLKQADALLEQGLSAELAYRLAYEVYQKHGVVRAAWFPSWLYRKTKRPLPDPNDRLAVIGAVVEGGYGLPLSMLRRGATSIGLLFRASRALGNYEGIVKWGEMLIQAGNDSYSLIKTVEHARLALAQGIKQYPYRRSSNKNTWRPLPLKFREEDYFILVPLDQACKVLGIPFQYKVNPKTGKRTGAKIGEKGLISLMGRPFARNIRGEVDDMAYAPYEEDGVAWVPFYWLAKQAGIRGWEVRNGKIYVAPK
ncbi:MAG: hypothetical protein DFNUSKGM_000520 [Candidatus Fervidibacter sacchari]